MEFGNNYTNYTDNLDNCCNTHYDLIHPIEDSTIQSPRAKNDRNDGWDQTDCRNNTWTVIHETILFGKIDDR